MSAIFFHDEEQRKVAEETKKDYQLKLQRPIVTKILPAQTFYDAEHYHQKYILRQCSPLLDSLGLTDEQLVTSHTAARLNGYIGGYGSQERFEEEAPKLGLHERQIDGVKKAIARGGGAGCAMM